MSEDGFDNEAYNRAADFATQARVGKETFTKAPKLQKFDLSNFSLPEVKVHKRRLIFPKVNPDLGFSLEKLVVALISGDFVKGKKDEVEIYYPHIRQGKVIGKTVFSMKLQDAVNLLIKCAQELSLPSNVLKAAINGYSFGFTYFREEDWQLHERDIAPTLASRLS